MTCTETESGFADVVRYIDRHLAFEPGSYNESYLDRRISARMRRVGTESYHEYLEVLSDDESEQSALLDALSINVTEFFRNEEVWTRLQEVLSRLTDDRSRVRCWSAACADGREPYSLAMMAREDPAIDDSAIRITATDIDKAILRTARRGTYLSSRTTDIRDQLELLSDPDAHVEFDGNQCTIKDPVKRMVSFEHHDLISGEKKSGYDLVLCRNLLIYIDRSYKGDIFETITGSIAEGGYLTIGKSETLHREFRERYEAVDTHAHIYRKKSAEAGN